MAGMQWRISARLVASKSKNFLQSFWTFFIFQRKKDWWEHGLPRLEFCALKKMWHGTEGIFMENQNEEGKEN